MDEMQLIRDLQKFDFSLLHPARKTLLEKLLMMHRKEKAANPWQTKCMNFEELDNAIAAGTSCMKKPSHDEENKD